jgi:DNA-binding CsgD family transcriptional regulator/predicted ATPase
MVMVGRSGELRRLTSAWAPVVAGQPGAAVVTGDPGVGKSLLAATAVEGFVPRPSVVLSGAARVHSPAPYDWLASVLSGVPYPAPSVPPEALAWLAQHPDAPAERYTPDSLLRMAVRVVRDLVGHGPAVLLVEDLHALDPASLNLVGELATSSGLPALLLVTSQVSEESLVSRTLARLCGVPGAVRAHLGNAPTTELTAREHEVLSCLANGMSNKQIARSLGISVRTVTVHVSNLLRKTGSASRTEAALWAVRHQPVAGG